VDAFIGCRDAGQRKHSFLFLQELRDDGSEIFLDDEHAEHVAVEFKRVANSAFKKQAKLSALGDQSRRGDLLHPIR
jgi:hypothetical protein